MLRSSNDLVSGQNHQIKVEKLPSGQFRASAPVLGDDKVAPCVAERMDLAVGALKNRLEAYDRSGESQK